MKAVPLAVISFVIASALGQRAGAGRLMLLTPDIVEAILDGRQPVGLQLDGLMKRLPVEWQEHRNAVSDARGGEDNVIAGLLKRLEKALTAASWYE